MARCWFSDSARGAREGRERVLAAVTAGRLSPRPWRRVGIPGEPGGTAGYSIANVALPKTLESLAWVTLMFSAPALPNMTPPRKVCDP